MGNLKKEATGKNTREYPGFIAVVLRKFSNEPYSFI